MVNSTPAMVLPVRSWMIPAISWTIPPDMSATANTIGVTASFTQPMLIALSMNVGTANAASASGPEFPQPVRAGDAAASGGAAGAGGGFGLAGLSSRWARPVNVVDIRSSSGRIESVNDTLSPGGRSTKGPKASSGRSGVPHPESFVTRPGELDEQGRDGDPGCAADE